MWSPRNRRPNVEKIKSALVAFKDVVKAVRDTWKEKSQAMKTAENQSENDKAAELKKEVILQRRLMDVVVTTTLEKGHPIIVEKYVLFHFVYLAVLADHHLHHGCRRLKRIESHSHVILLAWTISVLLLIMAISKSHYSHALRVVHGIHPKCREFADIFFFFLKKEVRLPSYSTRSSMGHSPMSVAERSHAVIVQCFSIPAGQAMGHLDDDSAGTGFCHMSHILPSLGFPFTCQDRLKGSACFADLIHVGWVNIQ